MNCCEEYGALLDLYVDGELEPREALRVRDHLEQCPACQRYVDDAFAIRAAFPDVEDAEVPDGFAESVCAVIQAADTAPKRNRRRRWAKTLLPMAACCAIVILLSRLPVMTGDTPAAAEPAATAEKDDSSGHPRSTLPDSGAALYSGDTDAAGPYAVAPASQDPAEDAAKAARKVAPNPMTAPPPQGSQEAEDAAPNAWGEAEQAPADDPAADEAPSVSADVYDTYGEDVWVENGNVVFASTVYVTREEAGDALADFEGKPYSNANRPEEGVIGTGYALDQADFERILYDVLDCPLGLTLNQDPTTELSCIVVTDQ